MIDIDTITQAARELAIRLSNDIANTQSRGEYVRITQFAMEADRIATALEKLGTDDDR